MDAYTLADTEYLLSLYITCQSTASGTIIIAPRDYNNANGDSTDALALMRVRYSIPDGSSIRIAWDNDAGAPGTNWLTLVGKSHGIEGVPGGVLTAEALETVTAAPPGPTANWGRLHVTSDTDTFLLVLHFKKIGGYGGYPAVRSDTEPMGVKTLT